MGKGDSLDPNFFFLHLRNRVEHLLARSLLGVLQLKSDRVYLDPYFRFFFFSTYVESNK